MEKESNTENILDNIQLLKDKYDFLHEDNDEEQNDSLKEKTYLDDYYELLYKEFCIGDLSQYKQGKIGLRWCTETDIIKGKGYKICGNSSCERTKNLQPYEVNMRYKQEKTEEYKNALVKLYLCKHCAHKLRKMYKYQKEKKNTLSNK